jgi:hypothetical protein
MNRQVPPEACNVKLYVDLPDRSNSLVVRHWWTVKLMVKDKVVERVCVWEWQNPR